MAVVSRAPCRQPLRAPLPGPSGGTSHAVEAVGEFRKAPPHSLFSNGVDFPWPRRLSAAESATPPAPASPTARTPPRHCSAPSTAVTTAARPATDRPAADQ